MNARNTESPNAQNGLGSVSDNVPTDISPQIAKRAVEWLVDVNEAIDKKADILKALQEWRDQHPDHERAWKHIESVNNRFGMLDVVAKSVAHSSVTHPQMISRREMIKALSVALFAGGAAWTAKEQTPWQQWIADQKTGVGEQRTVQLADGSQIEMNTDSAFNLFDNTHQRGIHLVNGELLISTGLERNHKPSRPLTIQTSQGSLVTSKARFSIRLYDRSCQLSVFDGSVEIKPILANDNTQTIKAGQQVNFTKDVINKPLPVNLNSIAWAQGMIVARGMRLKDFLTELSRYRHGRLRCADNIADLRVSGTYPLASTDRIIAAIEASLSIKAHYMTRYFVTLKPATS
ncbi:FecR domain-containing protein [Litoribacillus peritrichatus]|uniref:FecR family protein n=1 Tax=Litoribacillus peritrichatus TaxID=718191 RepID=A0ABP7N4J8_9GAMM